MHRPMILAGRWVGIMGSLGVFGVGDAGHDIARLMPWRSLGSPPSGALPVDAFGFLFFLRAPGAHCSCCFFFFLSP